MKTARIVKFSLLFLLGITAQACAMEMSRERALKILDLKNSNATPKEIQSKAEEIWKQDVYLPKESWEEFRAAYKFLMGKSFSIEVDKKEMMHPNYTKMFGCIGLLSLIGAGCYYYQNELLAFKDSTLMPFLQSGFAQLSNIVKSCWSK